MTAGSGQTIRSRTAARVHRDARPTAILVLACAAQFMVVLDVSVVNVALPSVKADLGFTESSLQWIVNAYVLTFAGLLLLGGRLADLYGRRRIFVTGLAVFSIASLIAGLAGSAGLLIAGRAGQGVGAAILAPATLTLLTTTLPEGPERTRALATWTAVGLAGGTAGNLIGGALTEYLSWRWILLVNVPIGAAAVAATMTLLTRDDDEDRRYNLDVRGALLATVGVASLTFGVTETHTRGWTDPVWLATIVGGVVLLTAFMTVEARLATAPLMPARLFRIRSVLAGNVVMLLAGAALMPMWVFLTLVLQQVLHYSALQTGLAILPHTLVTMLVAARITPRLMDHIDGRTLIIAGALLAAAGFAWQATIGADSDYLTGVLGPAIVFSTGAGLLITPATTAVTTGVGAQDAGAASGMMNTAKQVGGALGLAILFLVAAPSRPTVDSLADDYARAFLAIAAILVLVAAAALALPARTLAASPRWPVTLRSVFEMCNILDMQTPESLQNAVLVRAVDAEVLSSDPGSVITLLADADETGGLLTSNRSLLRAGSDGAPPHFHERAAELFFVLAGSLQVLLGERVVTLEAGDLLVVPPRVPHAFAPAPGAEADVLFVFTPGKPRSDYYRLLDRVYAGDADAQEIVATQDRFDNHYVESAAWAAR